MITKRTERLGIVLFGLSILYPLLTDIGVHSIIICILSFLVVALTIVGPMAMASAIGRKHNYVA